MSKRDPETLQEAIVHFADADVALQTMVELRWPSGVHCPTCGRTDVTFIPTRRVWTCKTRHPKWQFSAKVGTIFEDSPLGLDKWFAAVWLVANCKNGVSSYEVARDLGVTQKSAWFMLHRIRLAMKAGSILKMDGEVEADETYMGGKIPNMSLSKRAKIGKASVGRGSAGKRAVVGILQRKTPKRSSKVKATHVGDVRGPTLKTLIRENVEPGSRLLTDNWAGYRGLRGEYLHEVVDHAVTYVQGTVHTNGIENYWSLLKRTIRGTYVSVEPFHLGRYLDEQSFRFNERDDVDSSRFRSVLKSVVGRRLTYKELTGNGEAQAPT
jgi:transposase-like protein